MQRWLGLAATVVLLLGTIGMGVVHGRLSNRWGVQPDSTLAARRLAEELPKAVGQWRLLRQAEIEKEILGILQCPAYVNRTYEHQQTGDKITVLVLLGPPGPISVHTPEICYSSRDYTVAGERTKVAMDDVKGTAHDFWDVRLTSNSIEGESLRVLYAWTTGKSWCAAAYPRFGYGGAPHLYKLQLACPLPAAHVPREFDPARDFLQHFLVQLQLHLVQANRGT